MRILLLGEYSGLHVNLAGGLRILGHEVVVASDGDYWKDYPRDINFKWCSKYRKIDIIRKLLLNLPRLKGFDVVQLINPVFLDLRVQRNLKLFNYLKKHNRSVFLGANGDDYVYVNYALNHGFSTSIFNHENLRTIDSIKAQIEAKLSQDYKELNVKIAESCNGITACCTEYKIAYDAHYSDKVAFIPLPIRIEDYPFTNTVDGNGKVRIFLGIQEQRKVIKGMDVIYSALLQLQAKYPDQVELTIARNEPFEKYKEMMNNSHVLCDQLYSSGCGMNGAMAMAKGLIVAGGGEEVMYSVFDEKENKPLVNLPDSQEEVLEALENVLKQRNQLPALARQSRVFAIKHHDHVKVAQRYLDFWESRLL